jgi:outer membrane protein TolC
MSMMQSTTWYLLVCFAWLLCSARRGVCADDPPAPAQAHVNETAPKIPPPRPRSSQWFQAAASSRVDPGSSKAQQALDDALPSAVSPAIARFVRQSGRDSAVSTVPSAGAALPVRGARGSPVPPPRPFAGGLAQERQPAQSLPPALFPTPSAPARMPAGGVTVPPSPLSTIPVLKAPFEPTDLRFPINLATALRLADARPLIVAAAQARVWVAEGELTQAKVLWIPDLITGAVYIRHDGGGPDFNKGILTAVSVNYFQAGGGLNLFLATTDAIFQPLVARQNLNARHWDVQGAKNDALLETADAYFMVHQYRGIYAGALYTVERAHEVVRRISVLSRDLVQAYEVDRARNMLADLEQQAISARQHWLVQSTRLTRALRLDPRAVVEPLEHDHLQITLIDPGRTLDDLMPIALANRPEIASQRAQVNAAALAVRREKARPLLPSIVLTGFQSPAGMLMQYGIFGIGYNNGPTQWTGRDDVSIQLVWQLEFMGIGNLARIKGGRGGESRAIVELRNAQDKVAAEVNQTHARVQSAALRVVQADRSLRASIIAFNGSLEGLNHTVRFGDVLELISRPQEAIYALQLLKTSFDEYFRTVAEYNRTQFELFHALGYPAYELAQLRPPGDTLPVQTARPSYLPTVGNGPPPATR